MRAKKVDSVNIERIQSSIENGLSESQVKSRVEQGLVNKTKMIAGKTYWEIIRTDVLCPR